MATTKANVVRFCVLKRLCFKKVWLVVRDIVRVSFFVEFVYKNHTKIQELVPQEEILVYQHSTFSPKSISTYF